jgi:hypothetical protein
MSVPAFVARMALPEPHAQEVLPGVWLGDAVAAGDGAFLAGRRIGAVCNCTRDVPFHPSVPEGARHRVPVDDNRQPDQVAELARLAAGTVAGLVRARAEGRTLLVHCAAGRQRSAAVVAMLVMAVRGCGADEAVAFVRAVRPAAFFPEANFAGALRAWEGWLAHARAGFGTPEAPHAFAHAGRQ